MTPRGDQLKSEPMADRAKRALTAAFEKLVVERRKNGETLVIWRDGKICHVPASDIHLPSDQYPLMAYDERLAEKMRSELSECALEERKMFGGLAFLDRGHMCCGIVGEDLVVRIGREETTRALRRKHVREMDFTGRAMAGMVFVSKGALRSSGSLRSWLRKALDFTGTLPPKKR